MNRRIILLFVAILCVSQTYAQVERSADFHDKYKLVEVVVFSRHNVRAPMSTASKSTTHPQYDFGVKTSELTMKGGQLETIYGQFFQQWFVSEGLFDENAEPKDNELMVLANSKQRTIATARYFMAGFLPMKDVKVCHKGKIGDMDAAFTLCLGNDLTEKEWAQIRAEYDSAFSSENIRKASESLQAAYDLLSDIQDVDHNSSVVLKVGDEPSMTATLSSASRVVDAMMMECYETGSCSGRDFTLDEWRMLTNIIAVRDEIRFASPFVQRYVSKGQRDFIANALLKKGCKFAFMCGHETNIHNILRAMGVENYETAEAIEIGVPIGSKIVFEKWVDSDGNVFVAVNHVYQTFEQLIRRESLTLQNRPYAIPLQFEGLHANDDGLYPINEVITRLSAR